MTIQTLKIELGIKPGLYKFSVDGVDISNLISGADISFSPGEIPCVKLHVAAHIDTPDNLDALIFTAGERTNGDGC